MSASLLMEAISAAQAPEVASTLLLLIVGITQNPNGNALIPYFLKLVTGMKGVLMTRKGGRSVMRKPSRLAKDEEE